MPKKRTFNSNAIYVTEKVRLQLNKIPFYPCTIIEAPMGYGKTTAVREYLKDSDCTVLWQKVFNHSISGFWSMFCRQVRTIDAGAAEHLTQLGFPCDSTTREKALDLIQSALPSGGSIWVVDDYHLTDCIEIAGFIEYLLWNELPNFHIILSARYTHFDNLEEMTLKGYINHILKDALELGLEDIISYYRLCGIALKEKDSLWLQSYTEGWITGLYLLMLSYQSEGVFEATANITALIDKTIYAPFSEEIKELLMTVCFFEAFSQEQAAHMWEKGGSTELLETLSGRNGFIVWEARNGVYQVHKIFSEFLRGFFDQNTPDEKRKIYGRAASWYKQTEDYIQAMEYYQLAQDFDGLLTALQLDQGYSMHNEYREKLITYMEACPEEIRMKQPFALLVYAMCLFSYNETERYASVCGELADLLESGKLEPETARELAGEFEVLQSFTDYNDIEKMLEHYKRAGALMESPARFMDTRGGWTFGSPSILYMFHRRPGELERELNSMQEAMPFYDSLAKGHGRGAEFVMESERDYFRGDLDSAEISAYKAYLLSEGSKQEDILLSAVFLQAKIDLYKGNYGIARERLKTIREDLERGGWYNLIHTMELCEGWIQLCLGRKQDVSKWILDGEFFESRMYFPAMAMFYIVYGRALLLSRDYAKLLGSMDHFLEIASVFPNLLSQIYVHIYAAAANDKLHRRDKALEEIRAALALAMPDGLLMPFVENGDLTEHLLAELSRKGEYQTAVSSIRKLYLPYHEAVEQILKEFFIEKRPQLTERETEIASLVAQGFSNIEIGQRLFITQNTVKTMMKRIFEKLGIHSRLMLQQYIRSQE